MSLDPRIYFVVATAIIVKDGKSFGDAQDRFLIAKRASWEKAFPDKWTVPGGKLVSHEYQQLPKVASYDGWYNAVDWVLRKEIREEVNLEIHRPIYVCDVIFVRPDGFPVVTLSYMAAYKSGEVALSNALTEYAWVTLEEAKKYDLIEGIWDELEMAHQRLGELSTQEV